MDPLTSAAVILAAILLVLASGIWIYVGLILVAAGSLMFLGDMPLDRVMNIFGSIILRSAGSWELSAIPLFIWIGELILKTDISMRIFRGLAPIVGRLPGGLIHSNVFGCTLFSAICGSSAATTATVGRITITELANKNYRESLVLGSLAGSGSLGLLIPPSIVMIVYGVLAEVPIDRLFAAGILPGVFIALVFSAYVGIRCLISGDQNAPASPQYREVVTTAHSDERYTLWNSFQDLAPIMLIVGLVLGSIYTGLATPSEAAGIGMVCVLVLTAVTGALSWEVFQSSLMSTLHTSIMIFTVVIAASLISTALGYLHIPSELANFIVGSDMSAGEFILLTSVFFLFLGMILDGVSIIVMTLPILFSIVQGLGIDPIWFGIYLVIMVEVGQITPPVGFNLMIIHSISGVPISRMALYALPFCMLMCLCVAVFYFVPEIVMYLPNTLFN
ncbi:TRAP transporter large permease [Thalassospira sp. TSL5-1]|uniref:TRAP transporter large permease n=1 Tax=Thalassospira sp. TSL5-1 TaxID=1544451 RepID=UPI00093EC878|nr:TRAP transporter large permease subunit [Thalassospira sp. TSL5-1]OKH86796.1 C4-dicarboxylate ABC transporter permease [Thalassospira sp. TSL5-1]